MVLNEKQKNFLKDNKDILIDIFNIRLDELINAITSLNPLDENFSQKASVNLLFIKEFKDWIKNIEILSKPNSKEKSFNKDYI